MTRFALVLVACVPCVMLQGQHPKQPEKAPATELEGVWQEPARPGEDAAAVRFKFTFTGEKVTVCVCNQSLSGTFTIEPKADPPILSIVCRESGKLTIVRGRYELKDGRLCVCLEAEGFGTGGDRNPGTLLGPGAVRLTLEKAKK